MAEYDLVVRGGTVVTGSDTMRADIGIRDGRIAALGEKLEGAGVILVSQNHKEIQELCSSLIWVHNGEAKVYEDVAEGIEAFQEMLMKATKT